MPNPATVYTSVQPGLISMEVSGLLLLQTGVLCGPVSRLLTKMLTVNDVPSFGAPLPRAAAEELLEETLGGGSGCEAVGGGSRSSAQAR